MSILDRALPGTTRDPLYPDTDGFSMVESDHHYLAIKHLYGALSHWYRKRDDVHVAANMALYYEEGCPAKNRGPDLMVSKGVRGKHLRRSFRTWEEGVVPAVIIEVTSMSTQREDALIKPRVYSDIGVKEYFMFDPEGEYLDPRLKGFQLVNDDYEVLAADESGGIVSSELGLRLVVEGDLLRLIDPATGYRLPTEDEYAEEIEEAQRAVQKAVKEAAAGRQRVAALEAELQRLRASMPPDANQ